MRSSFDRLVELYRDGGFSEVKRGIFDRIVTSGPSKRARRKITKILGGDLIWDREWDVLLVLDACRADVFREHVGEVETIDSIGSTSQTWISRTFGKDDLNDVGYVTGNPFSTEIEKDRLGYFHVQSAELTDYGIETVPPIVLAEHAIDVWRRRDKIGIDRLIVHFMQPHTPFRSRPEWFQNAVGDGGWSGNFWRQFRGGEFKHDDVWAAYEDNLQWVIEEGVEPIQKNCEGLIALTADHGNAMGEWGVYGHPLGCPISVVRKVPWEERTGTDRETIQPDRKAPTGSIDIQSQLEALGYK